MVLSIGSERELIKAMRNLDDNGIRYRYFIDSDLDYAMTAIASEPITNKKRRKVFKEYKLLKL